MTRALILLGITALACRGKDSAKPATPGSAEAPVAAAPAPAPAPAPALPPATRATTEKPVLPAIVAPGSGALTDRFATEEIDPEWREKTEAALKKRYAKMEHPPSDTECKRDICRLTLAGSPQDLAAAIDELQALNDTSQSLLLTRPEPSKIVAYLVFERAAP